MFILNNISESESKYNIGSHNCMVFTLYKIHTRYFDIISHNIIALSQCAFIDNLCLLRDEYTVFNNCKIAKEELAFI